MKLTEQELKDLAKEIFKSVESELRGGKGIGNEWDYVDDEIQQEIRDENEQCIFKILQEKLK